MKTALSIRNIVKEFSGVRVLNDISVDIRAGEVFGILGENGAGKSTLLKIICGIYTATSGSVGLKGKEVAITTPMEAKQLGISMIPQEFNLIQTLSVAENIFLGSESKKGFWLDKSKMRARASALLSELQTDISPDTLIEDLSVAEKQMVEISKALVHDSDILIMDEPTTVLTNLEVDILFTLIDKLKEKGVTVLFISHKLKEVKRICDRILVLRDGDQICINEIDDVDEEDMARKMVGRELNQVFPTKSFPGSDVILRVEGLADAHLLQDISFDLKKGELLGFAGLIGAGRTEVAESVMGLRPKLTGDIFVAGEKAEINSTADALNYKLGYLSEDRKGKGLILNFDIPKNISLISLAKYCNLLEPDSSKSVIKKKKNQSDVTSTNSKVAPGNVFSRISNTLGLVNKTKEKESAEEYIDQFNIKAASLDAELEFLSGGNQQKVYLSKWMDTEPKILILDEPTRGIDVNAKKEIYHFVNSLIRQGVSCLLISSELEEIIGLCTRVLVMREGRIVGEMEGADINEESIMLSAAGVG